MLREAHREPIADAHYAAVRARVLAEIAAGKPLPLGRRLGWKWATCGVAAALAMFAIRPTHVAAPLPRLAPAAIQSAIGLEPAPLRAVAPRIARPVHRRHLATVAEAYRAIGPRAIGLPDPQPLVVKLITDDPDVVIYWIAEPKGGY
jgi:hypothetical protein